ncbi:hypothetical protein J6I90_05480 [Pseudidiomarina sp. 1APP75-32.1]|uniref:Uncharacterized protein n=1 Tax=Pseudidiomarina terrestris TaxID=2820060 RepID=A0AAW7R1A6_9GAMM|nr:hypothetical protein [Pseudidiomarina sp. 1APP75-32.1]MDN7124324.1 hypothetical protein [Pseudidiomarina sp. 1APP75-32.1]
MRGVIGVEGNPQAGGNIDVVLLNVGSIQQIIDYRFAALLSVSCRVDIGQRQHKFVTANACDHVLWTYTATELLGNMLEQAITDILAQRVINVAQMVKVQH